MDRRDRQNFTFEGAIPGNQGKEAIVFPVMAVNPDPKPGRWILPLVVLGMVAFTYFFVRELPEATPESTLASGIVTTTLPGDTQTTLDPGTGNGATDPEVQAYIAGLEAIDASLQLLQTEMVAVNQGFDADPREIEYPDTEARMESVLTDTNALADQVAAMVVPAGFENNHQALTSAIDLAAGAAADALDGLQSSDPGDLRRAAVAAYTQAADNFNTEVVNTKAAAGVETTP